MGWSRRAVIIGLPLGLAACVEGQPATGSGQASVPTPWPDFQPTLRPRQSASPNIATLPADLAIAPPGPEVPPVLRGALGRWEGWTGRFNEGSVAIVIQQVGRDGGQGRYAFADAQTRNFQRNWSFQLVNGNELRGPVDAAMVTLRPRGNGHMDFMFQVGGGWSVGVLSRVA